MHIFTTLIARTSTSLMTKKPAFYESGNEDSNIELATRSRLHYHDIYSDCTSEEDVMQPEKLPVIGFESPPEVLSSMYVLAEVPCEDGKGRKLKELKMFRYAAICQGSDGDENFISVKVSWFQQYNFHSR